MATYKNGKLVSEKTKGLTINVYVKDGEIDEVKTGTHLGQGTLELNDDGEYVGFSHYRPNSKLPVSFIVDELGTAKDVTVQAEGLKDIDVSFDALAKLDEPEKVEALTDEEKKELGLISLLKLIGYMLESHKHEPPTTPMEDAAIAILQHEDIPVLKKEPNTEVKPGPLADVMVTLSVGDEDFTEESPNFIASICNSDGRVLYQYNWTGVKLSVLDEPND